MPGLFESYKLKEVTLRNRIGVSPMCQYSSKDGFPTDWHLVHLGARALGGAGLIIAEATAVEPRGRISPDDAGLWDDAHIEPLSRINSFIKQYGAVPGIQIAHAGRKASCARPWEGDHSLKDGEGGWDTIAPSPIAFGHKIWKVPNEMTKGDIESVKRNFADAAKRAHAAGYEWLEIHAAHGYLCHEFYSPLSNHRTDEYGGSFENRIRFVLETVDQVRNAWPENLPLTIRLSCSDWVEGGWTIEETVELSSKLKGAGVDLIDCSSGFNTVDYKVYPFGPGWQVPFSERIRKEVEIPTAAVGLIIDPKQADEIIRGQKADIVLLARQMLREPFWPYRAAKELSMATSDVAPAPYGHWI